MYKNYPYNPKAPYEITYTDPRFEKWRIAMRQMPPDAGKKAREAFALQKAREAGIGPDEVSRAHVFDYVEEVPGGPTAKRSGVQINLYHNSQNTPVAVTR